MERDTIIAGAAVGISAAALILAGVTKASVASMNEAVNFDTSVKVAAVGDTESDIMDEDYDGEYNEEAGEASTESPELTSSESDASTATTLTGATNIILEDGVIKLTNSVIKVPAPGTKGNENVGDLYLYLPGTNSLTYDSTTNYLVLNNTTIVRTINAIDATYEGISQFTNEDGNIVLIGEKAVDDNTAIAVVHTITASNGSSAVDIETETAVVQNILDGTYKNVQISEASMFGYDINPEWVADMVIADEGLELIKGEKAIYVTPYSGTFASGTTNSLEVGSVSLTYSDDIHDDSTGYTPYILDFSINQDGSATSSSNTMQAKVLSQSNIEATDLFTVK